MISIGAPTCRSLYRKLVSLVDPTPLDCIDDPARLAALEAYDILDTPAEQGFDDIVQVAAHLCRAPIALVSLVDTNRQWFKARFGLEATETPITQSVCSLGLSSSELLIIPDLTQDPRTLTNGLVTGEAALRFYAGAPLVTPEGAIIGMLCVIDYKARPEGLDHDQRTSLGALSRQVVALLELRRSLTRAAEAETERRLLNEEMSHRLKNTLALVQGIANQTLKTVADRAAVSAFDDRLLALASAHDILVRESWTSAQLRLVVEGGIDLHGRLSQTTISGPPLLLGPRSGLSVAMLIHELASNAVKHGAFSCAAGEVAIEWRIEPERKLVLRWTERGGPGCKEVTSRGFGSKLIKMGIAGARDVTEIFEPAGYSAEFRVSLDRLREV